MIQGIPYFGEKTQEIYEFIQSNRYDEAAIAEVSYESLYELIISNIDNNCDEIIIINPQSEESKKLEENKKSFIVDRQNKKIGII